MAVEGSLAFIGYVFFYIRRWTRFLLQSKKSNLYIFYVNIILDFGEGFADFRHFFAVVGKQFLIMVFAGFVLIHNAVDVFIDEQAEKDYTRDWETKGLNDL